MCKRVEKNLYKNVVTPLHSILLYDWTLKELSSGRRVQEDINQTGSFHLRIKTILYFSPSKDNFSKIIKLIIY